VTRYEVIDAELKRLHAQYERLDAYSSIQRGEVLARMDALHKLISEPQADDT
jgi:hypothetical protein